ncbi:MAG: DNA/RNA nuclease SfsA [Thermodesulfobacteriota bacterium]|nr:DNA/RNA nuclease SfsA [Thermodesulfobacteriota bacterium]
MPSSDINKKDTAGLAWPPLIRGTLIKRYKRFLADVEVSGGKVVTAHCPNTGSMNACSQPGRPVYISRADNPKRKLKYTWELIEMPDSLVGVNTLIPNRLVAHAIQSGQVEALSGYEHLAREVKVGDHSRIDICLSAHQGERCYVEVKNCTLVENSQACFPDAVTTRGLKHLNELRNMVNAGHRGVMFYLVQRMDARIFAPADHIDPDYGRGLRTAIENGVEILAYDVTIDLAQIRLNGKIPILLKTIKR